MSDRIKSDLRRQEVAARVAAPSKSALTKAAILDSAGQFLETYPFRDLTVGTLMQDAGFSRPTFYQYFNDLHGLMETLLDAVKGGIIEGAQPWLTGERDPVASLHASLSGLIDVGYEHGHILKAVSDATTSDARLELVWETFLASFDTVVAARIVQDQVSGVTPDFDPKPVARALNRMDAAVLISSFGHGQKADKNDVLEAIVRIWMSTLYPVTADATVALTTARGGGGAKRDGKTSHDPS